jgi:hypothetical protein
MIAGKLCSFARQVYCLADIQPRLDARRYEPVGMSHGTASDWLQMSDSYLLNQVNNRPES